MMMRQSSRFFAAVGVIAFSVLAATTGWAQDEAEQAKLEVGDPVPEFEAKDDSGQLWKSSDHVGDKILVVYFYPADMTGGCTKQACAFRDAMDELEELDVAVVGVSGDSVENHKLFKKAHNLNFPLLADEEGKVAKKFGVPVRPGASIERVIDDLPLTLERGVTAARWTFVIDKDGRVAAKNTSVNPTNDAEEVKKIVRELQENSS